MMASTALYHRNRAADRSFVFCASLAVAFAVAACASGCDGTRRATAGGGSLDAKTYNPGGWYDDADATVGEFPTWDGLVGSADAIAIGSDGATAPQPGAVALACGGATAKPDGSCCPPSQGWDQLVKACQSFSLPECPDPTTCAPKWCADWSNAAGQPCTAGSAACSAVPRACTAAEALSGATCPAGQVLEGAACRPAGAAVHLPGGELAAAGLPEAASPALAPPASLHVTPPPPLAPQADLKLCQPQDQAEPACGGCLVGQAKGAAGACIEESDALPAWCPPGFVASADAVPSCAPDPADCAAAPYAGVADGPGHWFVDSQAGAEALGTQAAPFATLAQALAAAKAAGMAKAIIALAAGDHPLPPGKTLVPAGVTILGRCASLTKLVAADNKPGTTLAVSGAVEGVTLTGGEYPLTAGGGAAIKRVHLLGGSAAALLCSGCTAQQLVVSAAQRGIQVDLGSIGLVQVRIQDSADRALSLAGGATATLTDVVITGAKPSASGTGGYGILLAEAATATGQGIRILGSSSAAIAAFDPGSSAHFSRAWIGGTKALASSGEGGQGLLASGGGRISMDHGRLSGNQGMGALSWGAGSVVRLLNCVVEGTQASPNQTNGDGLRAQHGGGLQLTACLIHGNRSRGILVSGSGSSLVGERLVIRDTLPRASDQSDGYGLWVEDGGTATVSLSRLQGNRKTGAGIAGKGSHATLQGLDILATLPSAKDAKGGYGILVAEGASAQLAGVRLSGNHAVGLWVSDGASAVALQLVIDHTAALANLTLGRGIQVSSKGKLQLGSALIYGNRDVGVLVDGAGATLQLGSPTTGGNIVAAMLPRASDGGGGRAVQVQGGAQAQLTNVHVSGARELAVAVSGANSQLALTQVWITETGPRASDLLMGRGVAAEAGAKLTVDGLTILQARDAGLSVYAAEVSGSDLWIDQTLPVATLPGSVAKPAPPHGRGLEISAKAKVQLQRVRLSRNREVALSVAHTGTVADLADLVIDGTLEEPSTLEGGRALQVIGGAKAQLRGARLQNNKDIAALVTGGSSTLTAYDLLLHQTAAEANQGARGLGLAVVGAKAQLTGALISGQRHYSVYSDYGQLTLVGAAVTATQPLSDGTAGQGVLAAGGALGLWGCQIKGHRGAAVVAQLATVTVERTALIGSQEAAIPGSVDLAADGLLLIDCLEASLGHAVVAGNSRAGVILHGGSALATVIYLFGNGFAWSVQAAAQLVSSAAVVQANLQNVWTGPALPWFHPPVAAQARPVLGPASIDGAQAGLSP